jgi:hypothetical protein
MIRRPLIAPLLAVLLLLVFQNQARTVATVNETLIPAGASWLFNDSGTDLGTAWRAPGYNDGPWSAGFAQLGYGDGDETTTLGFGGNTTNRYITYYFRHRFLVSNPAEFATLTARLLRDDGAVIYLNGVEVGRSNMPAGTITATTLAPIAVANAEESAWFNIPLDPSKLVAGINVIAVELHQSSASSSDISFDLELIGASAQTPPPVVTLVSPANQAVSNSSEVTFTANVSAQGGLASAALFLSGPPLTATFSGPAQVQDAQITLETPATPNGDGLSINVDGQTPHAHGLMRFPTLIGAGIGQVPTGAVISSATLQVNCTNPGASMNLYRLTQDWVEDEAAWNQRQFGQTWANPGADGPSSNAGVAVAGSCSSTGWRQIDITTFVQEWSNGAPNFGIVLADTGTDGIDFDSSESANSPVLTVVYKDALVELASQPVSGSSATVNFPATVTQAGTWFWNVRVTDLNGAQSWAPADFEFTMDPAVPDEPVLVSPANGATGVSPDAPLQAVVSTPTGGPLTVSVGIRRAAEDEFTVIALPDTQHYSEAYPAIFTSQTQWIKDNKTARNIVFVTHEGDIVQNYSNETEWIRANTSMSIMDGVVPYGMAPGNHDEPSTLYNQYFPYTRYEGLPWYGGHYQSLNDNNYQLFSAGGMDFIWMHLDFCPTTAVVSWASNILNSFPNRIGMMTTHAYLGLSAERNTHVCGSTQYLWDGLAVPTPNLHFMLSGHVHGESRRVDMANGHPVFQMLADYQSRASGGEGWLRILRFVPNDDRVYVQTYSPWLNQYETDADSEFALDFPMGGAFATAGTTVVPSGSTASVVPEYLEPNTEYEWQVTVTNGNGKTRKGPIWRFTTGAVVPPNTPPVANGNSYSTVSGTTLTTPAPGVLGNDSDAENTPLIAELVTPATNGSVTLNADGSFTYTPTAGFVGMDSFTYRASDGQDWSAAATVTIAVTAPQPVIVFQSTFATSSNQFTYLDNAFRGTTQAAYADGARVSVGGYTDGALRVYVGGVDKKPITNMSGGWQRTFTLAAPAVTTLFFRYNMDQGADYESDESSQVLASLNGVLLSGGTGDWVAQVSGNGDGGAAISTGWVLKQIELGTLPAGTHTLRIGGFNNKKDGKTERTTILIDDVTVVRR